MKPIARTLALALALALAFPLAHGCDDDEGCEEDPRAQVLDERVEVHWSGDPEPLLAELADSTVERERGWKYRRCNREALLLIPEQPGDALPIWGCGLTQAIDAAFVADGQIVDLTRIEPCPDPCGTCRSYGETLAVDGVLELPADARALAIGDTLSWFTVEPPGT